MHRVFADLLIGPKWHFAFFVMFLIVGCATAFYPFKSPAWHSATAFVTYLALLGFLAPPIIRVATLGHKHVVTVCFWTTVLLVAFIVSFYFWYFTWVLGASPSTDHDRILNLVAVVAAIVAASLGWYVHYQYSAKNHRTNNAFSMVMEMRKSSEFMRKHELVIKHFPANTDDIPEEYHKYFPSGAIRDLAKTKPVMPEALRTGALQEREQKAAQAEFDQRMAAYSIEEEKVQAVIALRYILNYFEFMAAGVKAKDLDEDLLLDTVSEIVIGYYDRSDSFIDHARSDAGGKQPLAYVWLEQFVADFRERVKVQKREREDARKKIKK